MVRYTTDSRLAAWLCDGKCDFISGYLLGRYGVVVEPEQVESWRQEYVTRFKMDAMPYLSDPVMWLKVRVHYDSGPGEMVDRVGLNDLHVFPVHWDHIECVLTASEVAEIQRRLRHLGESRSCVSVLSERSATPIDRTAARIVRDDSQACPWCREWFRNPNAMAIHADERHGQKVVVK